MKYIFVTGGVVSALGKGILMSALAELLQCRGYQVRLKKMDPYLNVDPGTMSPFEHGEVFITNDGAETDLDLGHYERFTNKCTNKFDSTSAGKIYYDILTKERKGDYLGNTVQIIPHITNAIKEFIKQDLTNEDFLLCEIGGTVGDIESTPFLEAVRQFSNEVGKKNVLFIHITLVPYLDSAKELKTKPTQHSVIELQSSGIQANILICRTSYEISEELKQKISLFCNVSPKDVIMAKDNNFIYNVPLSYHKEGLDNRVLDYFNLPLNKIDLSKWLKIETDYQNIKEQVTLAIVGKYVNFQDAYKSLVEAINHAGINNNVKVNILWIDADDLEKSLNIAEILTNVHGILVPGGFGTRGSEGMIKAVTYARENKIPYLGICFGMQLAIIEMARNLLGLKDATSSEFKDTGNKIIGLIAEWENNGSIEQRDINSNKGGTMRLGAYPCNIKEGSLAYQIYSNTQISERHRHRYEVNTNYKSQLEEKGIVFSGMSPNNQLTEIIELSNHPFFVGVQYHPELKSRPFLSHPLFKSYIKAIIDYKHRNNN